MKYPPINKQPHREVNIPEMSGGLNMRDSVSSVIDNQLTDSLNVWFSDGALRTRPSFATNTDMKISNTRISSNNEIIGFKPFPDIKNGDDVLVSFAEIDGCDKDDDTKKYQSIRFWWQGKNSISELPMLNITVTEAASYFVIEKNGTLYTYVSNYELYTLEYLKEDAEWNRLQETDFYVPAVYTHCRRSGWDDFEGVQLEGYNLLGNHYKMIYSAYNESDSDTTHPMRYALGQELPKNSQKFVIKISLTSCDNSGDILDEKNTTVTTYEHEIVYDTSKENHHPDFANGEILIERFGEGQTSPDGLRAFLKYNYVGFVKAENNDDDATKNFIVATLDSNEMVKRYACNEDNVVITAPMNAVEGDSSKVFNMTDSAWFGGSANGLSDGSRLFLCGNTNESEQSLVLWSGLNDPTYFPENNYVYVGNKTEPVKAFGKQDNKLVVFKPNETYYTYYVQNNNITAEDLINQTVVNYQANSVYFPFVLLNASIGCDCPDTVQLCRNRLVWAHSKGKVYTLVSDNQYNENSIYPVSEMVERGIKEVKYNFWKAKSCDFDGHYMLILGQDAFVMDYNSYGYQYVHSYSKSEDANVKIPWYHWKLIGDSHISFGENIAAFYSYEPFSGMDGIICASVLSSDNVNGADQYITLDNTDNPTVIENPIASRFTTKLFDFSGFRFRKNVDRVSIGFGNNGGIPITVRFVTDVGTEEENVSLSGNELTAYRPSYITVKQFNPCIRSVIRFGVEVECNGLLAVDAINLSYRLLGGAR